MRLQLSSGVHVSGNGHNCHLEMDHLFPDTWPDLLFISQDMGNFLFSNLLKQHQNGLKTSQTMSVWPE
jgi:hypothetical protein